MAAMQASISAKPVSRMRMAPGTRPRVWPRNSTPVIPGMRWSEIITPTSGNCCSSFSPSSPDPACRTSYPSACSRRTVKPSTARSSSTTSNFIIVNPFLRSNRLTPVDPWSPLRPVQARAAKTFRTRSSGEKGFCRKLASIPAWPISWPWNCPYPDMNSTFSAGRCSRS